MPNHTILPNLNSLLKTTSGIWIPASEMSRFEYSDGDMTEETLRMILSKVGDLSSFSMELEQHIYDWPSEYHLSPLRSNLLRYLDMSSYTQILELGCGCGALTRYLGEQGLVVDAIEGSQRRAELARLRCRDLDNVEVASSNFFDLSLPRKYYDIVFFVGVMEYCGRFSPSNLSAEQSVSLMLNNALEALTPEGFIVIAIENRIGRKYLCGAGEDHYGIPFEGINNYPNYSGIKTWSQDEWGTLLKEAGLQFQFHYPFPDYKLPVTILNSDYLLRNPYAWTHLQGIYSTDYHALIDPKDDLFFWKHAHYRESLGAFSNSFLIVASRKNNTFRKLAPYDFMHTTSLSRKGAYRTRTYRFCESEAVEKLSLYKSHEHNDLPLQQEIAPQMYHEGMPLSIIWLEELREHATEKKFGDLVEQYYDYLKTITDCTQDIGAFVDALPRNIMVSSSGKWNTFDTEWTTTLPISIDYIFFRGIFYFFESATEIFAEIYRESPTYTIMDVLESCFSRVHRQLENDIHLFLKWEETIQNCALENRGGASTYDFLKLRAAAPRNAVQLFWAANDKEFSRKNSLITYISEGDYYQTITFDIPEEAVTPALLRLDPGSHTGVFSINTITIDFVDTTESIRLQSFKLVDFSDMKIFRFSDILHQNVNGIRILESVSSDPYLVWSLPELPRLATSSFIRVEVALKWISTGTYRDRPDPNNHATQYIHRVSKSFLTRLHPALDLISKTWRLKK